MPGKKLQTNFWVYLLAVAVIIVIVILLVGVKQPKAPTLTPTPVVDSQVEQLQKQSTSDEVAAIEQDIANTNFSQIDSELGEIDKALQDL